MEEFTSFNNSEFPKLVKPPMAHISASIGHSIFLIGGYQISYENDSRTLTAFDKETILYYNVITSELNILECSYDMKSVGSYPTEFFFASGMGSCTHENRIYLFGGYSLSKQEACNALYYIEISEHETLKKSGKLDFIFASNSKPKAKLKFLAGSHDGVLNEDYHSRFPSYRDKASIVYWNQCLVVFGGYGSNFAISNSDNHHTDFGDDQFSHTFLGNHGENISGSGNRGWNNQVLIFSLDTMSWTNPATFGAVPCPRAAHSSTIIGYRMFVFGGRLGVRNTTSTIRSNQLFCLDLITLHWIEVTLTKSCPDDLVGRSWTTVTKLDDKSLFVLGGFSGDNVPLSDAYVISLDLDGRVGRVTRKQRCFQDAMWDPFIHRNSWNTDVFFTPVSRMWHSASLGPDGFVYVIGGCSNNLLLHVEEIQDVVERIRAEPQSLYRICLWNIVCRGRSTGVLNRIDTPDRLFNDLLSLMI